MSKESLSRRRFVGALPLTVLGAPSVLAAVERGPGCEATGRECGAGHGTSDRQELPPGFIGPFSGEEAAAVAASPMARDIATFSGQGYPCSEMMLLAALRRFDLPEDHLPAAAVFGGGVGKRDLCGLLTGGLMAIGFVAAELHPDRRAMRQAGRQASNAYWDWWTSRGDLHCMGPGTTHETSEEFVRMCQRTALKLEEVISAMAVASGTP